MDRNSSYVKSRSHGFESCSLVMLRVDMLVSFSLYFLVPNMAVGTPAKEIVWH